METRTTITEKELLEAYDEWLDDVYGVVSICGLEYSASAALRRIDRTAYRCGFNDWLDAEITDGRYEPADAEGDVYYVN
jgi:hypothetical protein